MRFASVRFVRSATAVADLPRDGIPQVALVGRSNVGKSSLINALAGTAVARVSNAPGKTRLMNVYRAELARRSRPERGRTAHAAGTRTASPEHSRHSGRLLDVVDLPGYGYARGGAAARRSFDTMARAYFSYLEKRTGPTAALLVVDIRHPGIASDVAAWNWLAAQSCHTAVVASKLDKLARVEQIRALELWQTLLNAPVLAASAVTGEGLEKLRNLIVRLLSREHPPRVETP